MAGDINQTTDASPNGTMPSRGIADLIYCSIVLIPDNCTRHRNMTFSIVRLCWIPCASARLTGRCLAICGREKGARTLVWFARRVPLCWRRWRATWDGPILYLTSAVRRAHNVIEQLPVWMDEPERLYRFAEPSALFYDRAPWDAAVIRNRIETLAALADEAANVNPVVVASARATMAATLPPSDFRECHTLPGNRRAMEAR